MFNSQLKISAGLLGESSWGTNGPELYHDVDDQMGIRVEWKPNFLSGLNLGFVVNKFGGVGIAYEHDYFAFRFAYRFDSDADWGWQGNEGARMVFRLEERILQKYLPGMQLWTNGLYYGINADEKESEYFMEIFR